jgi:hypothetical protein
LQERQDTVTVGERYDLYPVPRSIAETRRIACCIGYVVGCSDKRNQPAPQRQVDLLRFDFADGLPDFALAKMAQRRCAPLTR